MKFTSAKEIATKAATIKAYVREAMAAAKAGLKVETKPREFPVPEELKEKFRNAPLFKRAFEAAFGSVTSRRRPQANEPRNRMMNTQQIGLRKKTIHSSEMSKVRRKLSSNIGERMKPRRKGATGRRAICMNRAEGEHGGYP